MKTFIITLMIFFIPISIFGAGEFTIAADIEETITTATSLWTNVFSSHGVYILAGLGTIEIVLTFGFMALKGEMDFTGIMYALIRITLLMGFFLFLMGNSGVAALKAIVDSFKQLGTEASVYHLTADNVFTRVGVLYSKLLDGLDWNMTSLIVAGVGILVVYILLKVGIKMITALAFATLSIYAAALFFAFGIFSHTRQWGINALTNSVRYGARYMAILLLIGIAFSFVDKMIGLLAKDNVGTGLLFSLLIFALLLESLSEGIEDFIDGYITGLGGGSNFAAGQMLKQIASNTASMARNAAQGAMSGGSSALAQIKDANSAANAAGTSGVGKGKSAAGIAGGAIGGAMTGMAKGAMGFNTNGAGGGTGRKVGAMASKAANKASSTTTNTKVGGDTSPKPKESKEPTLKPGDKGYYHSSIPKEAFSSHSSEKKDKK